MGAAANPICEEVMDGPAKYAICTTEELSASQKQLRDQ